MICKDITELDMSKLYDMHITFHHDKKNCISKLDMFSSVNCECKRHCAYARICYDIRQQKRYKNLVKCLSYNEFLIINKLYNVPKILTLYHRLMSSGDINSIHHIEFIDKTVKANPLTQIGIWIREDMLEPLKILMDKVNHPNLFKVLSIKRFNYIPSNEECKRYNTSFTVYNDKNLLAKDFKDGLIDVICADKQCKNCLICYTKHDKCIKVGELIK